MAKPIPERNMRLCYRLIVELTSRTRCNQDLKGLASHCGVTVKEMELMIETAITEGMIDPSYKYITER